MITFDVLRTPPHACSTSTMLRLDAVLPQFPCLSSMPTPTRALSQNSANDESPSSDKENCSSYVLSKATTNANIHQASEHVPAISPTKHHMSFTPRRDKPPPRAWERRPATPFITRTEGQKIWKRVPLAELGIEANRQLSRQEKKDLEGYVRVVKRMRTNGSMDESNETVRYSDSLGTKWEEDSIEKGGSPKKKIRANNSETSQIGDESPSIGLEGNRTDASVDCPPTDLQEADEIVSVTQITASTASEESVGANFRAPDEATQDRTTDFESAPSTEDGPIANETIAPHIPPLSRNRAQTEGASLDIVSNPNTLEVTPTSELLGSNSDIVLMPTAPVESAVASNDDLQNLLMEEITTHKLSSNETGYTGLDMLDNEARAKQVILPTSAFTTATFSVSEHDETAFLRDFLHRAQASKAARVATSPQKKSLPLQIVDENEQLCLSALTQSVPEVTEENEDDDLSPPIENTRIEQALEATDTKFTSPTRRGTRASARKIHSRLPRSQTTNIPPAPHFGPVLPSQNVSALPSTIQLKRATGCEFIFTAKEQQTLAMMTRANTKKNQGGAIHVEQRLAQLKKESDAFQQNEQYMTGQIDHDEVSCDAETDENQSLDIRCALKKRKRDKQDDGKFEKVKRTVRWPSDEQLARYREASPFVESESPVEDGLLRVDFVTAAALAQPTVSSSATSEVTIVNAMGDANTKSKDATEESAKLKVRRIRKVKLDSVNGTPAPKTRSRSMIESGSDEVGPDISTVDPIDTSTSKAKTRRSSRMPVPVTTPIPLPSFSTTAKVKTRGVGNESSKSSEKVGSRTEENTTTQSAQDDRKGDGRRQLRTKRS